LDCGENEKWSEPDFENLQNQFSPHILLSIIIWTRGSVYIFMNYSSFKEQFLATKMCILKSYWITHVFKVCII